MEGSKVLRGIFFTLACALAMFLLYYALFGSTNLSGGAIAGTNEWEGALFYASRQIEHPISKYYYSYCYLPNIHMEDDIDASLGASIICNYDNIMSTESNLSSDISDNSVFSNLYNHYSDGWH